MPKFKFLIILAMSFIFVACGSKNDGTQYIVDISLVSQADKDSGIYPAKFKIQIKDKNGNYAWFYTNENYSVGDTLTLVLVSKVKNLESKVKNLELKVTNLTAEVVRESDFRIKVKALIVEFEATDKVKAILKIRSK